MKNHKYIDINWSCVTALRSLKKVKNTAKEETTSTKGEKSADDKGQTKTNLNNHLLAPSQAQNRDIKQTQRPCLASEHLK